MLKRTFTNLKKNTRKLRCFSTIQEQISSEWNENINDAVKRTNYLLDDHAPVYGEDLDQMLQESGVESLDQLIQETVPEQVHNESLTYDGQSVGKGVPVDLLHTQFKEIMSQNQMNRTYIGEGFYNTSIPHVIERCFLSNPGWYTAYTPYQAEISQGRMAGLMTYQELTRTLTGFEIAGASLLDEASSASEAMLLSYHVMKGKAKRYIVDQHIFPASLKVVQTNADFLGIEVVVADATQLTEQDLDGAFGVLFQNPDNLGRVRDLTDSISAIKAVNKKLTVSVGTDLAALMLFKSPADMGADVAYGNSQRFGVPLGFGGPAAAFFCTHKKHVRKIPGRIIGLSVDSQGNPAYRMALQTREQHIRREKATSNICTAQALLANMAGFYSVYHGEDGLRDISRRIHTQAQYLAQVLTGYGYQLAEENNFFDTIVFEDQGGEVRQLFEDNQINLRRVSEDQTGISLDESVTVQDLIDLITLFAQARGQDAAQAVQGLEADQLTTSTDQALFREESGRLLSSNIFHSMKGEHEMMRYLKFLENQDIHLTKSMISLGSCTMKLNSATEMIPLTWPELNLHPYVPRDQSQGYRQFIEELKQDLQVITNFDDFTFQPNSGASGEYAGLLAIKSYQRGEGQGHRNICLIPKSAHGTNPASAIRVGLEVISVESDASGNIDLEDLEQKCIQYQDNLSCFMITYPSTHGVYEDTVIRANELVHQYGGQVYLDGANMNAQVGLTSPGYLGADVCHLNLHKTFCIPHGGGGPGMGPIGVKQHLSPYLPAFEGSKPLEFLTPLAETGPISSAEFASASILSISWLYIKALGDQLTHATKIAILNANYMARRLSDYFPILFANENGRVAHEFIIDIRPIKAQSGISEEDIAKRLMDFGFHSPTMSFPVGGTMMIEPTESENKAELDRLCDALIRIRQEIDWVVDGTFDAEDNPLKNAPHTAEMIMSSEWDHQYTREQAAYPLEWVRTRGKYWPPVGRVNNVYGDRNLNLGLPDDQIFFQ